MSDLTRPLEAADGATDGPPPTWVHASPTGCVQPRLLGEPGGP